MKASVSELLKRFAFEKGKTRGAAEVNGKNTFLPRNDRPYGLKRPTFQAENAPGRASMPKSTTQVEQENDQKNLDVALKDA